MDTCRDARLCYGTSPRCCRLSGPVGALGLVLLLAELLFVAEAQGALVIKPPPLPVLPKWFYNGTYASQLCDSTSRCDASSRDEVVPACSCHANCSLYDACCEDVRPSDWRLRALPSNAFECAVYPVLGTDATGNFVISNAGFVFLITGCPSNYTGSCLARLCGSPTSDMSDGTLRFTWVTDPLTGITYRNRFCAACNGLNEEKMVFWNQTYACINDPSLSKFGITGCAHHVLSMESIVGSLPFCYGSYYSHCPKESSQAQQDACRDSPARYFYDRLNYVTYRNYNCSLCDTSVTITNPQCTHYSVSYFQAPLNDVPIISGAKGCLRGGAPCSADEERKFVTEACDRCRTSTRRSRRTSATERRRR